MAQKLNKHTPDSDDLLKRLETNDSGGLDDFEKEALEGFASLENPELARKLNSELTDKLNEVYFEKKQGKKTFYYLSIAAGLALVIGLSFIFYTFFNQQKQELALNKESELKEQLPESISAPAGETAVAPVEDKNAESDKLEITKGGSGSKKTKTNSEPVLEDATTKGAAQITTETVANTGSALKTNESANNGPATAAQAPAAPASEEQKELKREEKPADKDLDTKTASGKESQEIRARSTVPIGGLKKKATKDEAPAKEKRKNEAEGEALASDDYKADKAAPTVLANQQGAGAPGESLSENSLSQPVFANKNYSKPQQYIKAEIDKNEQLKNNVKEFKAKVTIDENGKVTKVKFLTSFANCGTCEKEVEKILLNMPVWTPAKLGGKTVKETIHFVYP